MTEHFTITRVGGNPHDKAFVYNDTGDALATLSPGATSTFAILHPYGSLCISTEQPLRTQPRVTSEDLEWLLHRLDMVKAFLGSAEDEIDLARNTVNVLIRHFTEIQAATIIHPEQETT